VRYCECGRVWGGEFRPRRLFVARRADGNTKQAAVVLAGPLHDQRDVRIIPLRAARSEGTGRLVEVRTEAATRPTSTVPP
jgi:hypothetical protein